MSSVLERTPAHVQAGLIDRVLVAPHPRVAIPTIASNAHMTLVDLQALLRHHGYPDTARLAASRDRLLATANAAEGTSADAAVDEYVDLSTPTGADLANVLPPHAAIGERLAHVPVAGLHADPNNPRDRILDTDVEELADSIAEIGLLQPIVARQTDHGLYVVAGHRRLTAIKVLGWTHAPVIIRADMRADDVLAAMLIENGQRRDLDPIEEARGLRKLKEQAACTDAELAKRIGRNQPFVSARLALLLLSPEDQDRVRAGELGIVQATNLGRPNGGKVRSKGRRVESHFDVAHELAKHANARCRRLSHKSKIAGGQACGECWESVIRADERDAAQKRHASTGTCPTCG